MSYHSTDGRHFLGWRLTPTGAAEVVYDCVDGARQVFRIITPRRVAERDLSAALEAAVQGRNVIASLYSELAARNIVVERDEETRV